MFCVAANDLSIGRIGCRLVESLCRCRGRCPDRPFHDFLARPQAKHRWIFKASMQCPCHRENTSEYRSISVAHILQRLIVFTINTGIWTACFALLSVILLRIYPRNLRYAMFAIPLCSIYCNTVLANLNVRVYCRDKMMGHSVDLQASEDRKTDTQSGETELVQRGECS
ncbi:hypothetical protein JVT61DRAFT_389 [Boletus reticuloceps]|uniref:DUF6534 domain-containing protein n=1 Tax=Boletus reticuloceps TaxID=495285 RepID=A0A8I3AFQ5_9AGAM|nr:hypothetical protein JVT61DRAFT_389 [Boletus reticuloceps]